MWVESYKGKICKINIQEYECKDEWGGMQMNDMNSPRDRHNIRDR